MAAKQKYSHIIHRIHDQWCLDNGYKPQATSWKPKIPSHKLHPNDMLDAENAARFVNNAKPQATSVKLQASSYKRHASKGRSSNKR